MEAHFAVFDTAIGSCGIVWRQQQILGTYLPERDIPTLRARIGREHPGSAEGAPPPSVQRVADGIVRLMAGEACDLSGAELDMSNVPAFNRRVYALALTIPPGRTLSYGEIADMIGAPGSARAVGRALGRNPFPIVVPCHRVLAAGGRSGGFSAEGGVRTKLRMLAIEQGAWIPELASQASKP